MTTTMKKGKQRLLLQMKLQTNKQLTILTMPLTKWSPKRGIAPCQGLSHRAQRCFVRKDRRIKLGSLLARQEENLTVDNLVLRAALGERVLVDGKIRFLREKGNLLPTRDSGSGAKMKMNPNQSFVQRAIQHRDRGRIWNGGRGGRQGGQSQCKAFGHDTAKCKYKRPEEEQQAWKEVGKGKRVMRIAHNSTIYIPSSSTTPYCILGDIKADTETDEAA
ncbi:hypothetical protein U1Q18_032362, partial [Sarracenia purpurea var. burkii]